MVGPKFERLVEIMDTLRGPDGCPWDREQDLKSLQPMLIEEVYEVVEAVDARDYDGLREELGDLLLHVVFHARLGREAGRFDIGEVVESISEKLIRRHPHVFGDAEATDAAEVIENWEAIKEQERGRTARGAQGAGRLLDRIPSRLPALHEAHKISARVARAGFDWSEIAGVFEKLAEEIRELEAAIETLEPGGSNAAVEEEIGDLLFVVVNLARFLDVDSESALKRANRKFRERFRYVEEVLAEAGATPEQSTLEEMERIWSEAKRKQAGSEPTRAGGDDAR